MYLRNSPSIHVPEMCICATLIQYTYQRCSFAQLYFNTRARYVYLRNSPSIHVPHEISAKSACIQTGRHFQGFADHNFGEIATERFNGIIFCRRGNPTINTKQQQNKKRNKTTHTHTEGGKGWGGGGGGKKNKTKTAKFLTQVISWPVGRPYLLTSFLSFFLLLLYYY